MTGPKILFIMNNFGIGGAERLVVGDINEMVRTGVNISLITLRTEPSKSFFNELQLSPEQHIYVDFKNFLSIPSWMRVVKAIRAVGPDLVITQLWFENTIGRIAARIAGVKKIISFEQNVYDGVKTKKMYFVDWFLQLLSTKIVAVSEAVKKSAISHGIKEDRIDVLYNAVDTLKFESEYDGSEIRREYKIPEESFVHIFIGRLIPQKAVDILIDAFSKLDSNSYLLIVGQGKERETLERRAEASKARERIIFAGVRDDVPKLLASADCFILPSRHEGLPLVLVEAMAAGSAVIVSDFEASGEIVTNEKDGLIVPRENADLLAKAMARLEKEPDIRIKLSKKAKETAQKFSISSHVQALIGYAKMNHS